MPEKLEPRQPLSRQPPEPPAAPSGGSGTTALGVVGATVALPLVAGGDQQTVDEVSSLRFCLVWAMSQLVTYFSVITTPTQDT